MSWDLIWQIFLGTFYLSLCSGVHMGLIILSLPWLSRMVELSTGRRMRSAALLALAFAVIVLGHSVQVWIWALSLLFHGALNGLEEAVYYALSTYTTLGYGDVLPADHMRIFGAFASVAGMLTFGVSAAFLVGVAERILRENMR